MLDRRLQQKAAKAVYISRTVLTGSNLLQPPETSLSVCYRLLMIHFSRVNFLNFREIPIKN